MKRFGAAMLGLGLLAASGSARAEQIVINQAGHSLTASSIYLAQDLGFFAKQGLDVQFISTGSGMKSIVPLVSGSAQFCACIVFHPLQANHAGAADTRMIAGITSGFATKIVLHKDVAERLHQNEHLRRVGEGERPQREIAHHVVRDVVHEDENQRAATEEIQAEVARVARRG
jgi:hypothetical protein